MDVKLMAISPGGEEAGGLQEKKKKQASFLVQVCVRLLLNHRSLGSKFFWTAFTRILVF